MANSVIYTLQLVDKYSVVAEKVAAKTKQMQSKIRNLIPTTKQASAAMKKLGGSMTNMANQAKLVSVASAAFIGNSIRLWDVQAKAVAQVETALVSTGNTAGKTMRQLKKEASELQRTSLFGDEDILQGVTAQMLTFKQITGDTFSRSQQAVVDMATRMKIDLKSASIQVGKALNDPKTGLSMLSRVGITFSDEQKEVIKTLQATGRMAEAQALILDELESQYKGSAKAASEAGAGGFKQLSMALGDAQEVIGGVIGKALLPMAKILQEWVIRFQEADPWVHKLVAGLAVLLAVVAPLLAGFGFMAIGIGALLPLVGALAAGVLGISLPVLLVIAAIAALVAAGWWLYSNWDEVISAIGSMWDNFVGGIYDAWNNVINSISDLWDGFVDGLVAKLPDFIVNAIGADKPSESVSSSSSNKLASSKGVTDNLNITMTANNAEVDDVQYSGTSAKTLNMGVNNVPAYLAR